MLRENLCQNPVFVGDMGIAPPGVVASLRALRLPKQVAQLAIIRAIVAAKASQKPIAIDGINQ